MPQTQTRLLGHAGEAGAFEEEGAGLWVAPLATIRSDATRRGLWVQFEQALHCAARAVWVARQCMGCGTVIPADRNVGRLVERVDGGCKLARA